MYDIHLTFSATFISYRNIFSHFPRLPEGEEEALDAHVPVLRKGGWCGWKPSLSSDLSIRAFRAHPLIEIRQAVPCRAIRGKNISVNSTLPPLNPCRCLARDRQTGVARRGSGNSLVKSEQTYMFPLRPVVTCPYLCTSDRPIGAGTRKACMCVYIYIYICVYLYHDIYIYIYIYL